MRETIVTISCDVCKQSGAKETHLTVVCMGNEYEYGVSSWTDRPIRERLINKELDLCDACANRLVKEPLHYTMGFHREGDYYFPKPAKAFKPDKKKLEEMLEEYRDILMNVYDGELTEADADRASILREQILLYGDNR